MFHSWEMNLFTFLFKRKVTFPYVSTPFFMWSGFAALTTGFAHYLIIANNCKTFYIPFLPLVFFLFLSLSLSRAKFKFGWGIHFFTLPSRGRKCFLKIYYSLIFFSVLKRYISILSNPGILGYETIDNKLISHPKKIA